MDAVRSLRRDAHTVETECWLHGTQYCLSCRELEGEPPRE
jgi:hypothetical protein